MRRLILLCLFVACRNTKPGAPTPATSAVSSPAKAKVASGFRIDCKAPTQKISPLIYGIGFDITGYSDWREPRQWDLRPSARRLGGNQASRYNWENGTAFNHGLDWNFVNNGDAKASEPFYASFQKGNAANGAVSAMQVPMLGWVAKDTTSVSFSTVTYAGQKSRDENRKAGNGVMISGREIEPPPPTTTSLAVTPEIFAKWLAAYREADAKNGKTTRIYILDNEPALWNSTHRDVHPEPMTYDELLDKTKRFAPIVRKADPGAKIAGPASFGFAELLYSAKDIKLGPMKRKDMETHGGLNMMPYYLKTLADHEKKTGERLLDLVDVHFYPQAEGMGVATKGEVDPKSAALRIRSTRALWDDKYVDESWIAEPVRLFPRLKEWIAQYYPGLQIQIGEWNFGAETHMSSGLATAEALGRFAEAGVESAFYWPYPKLDSPAYWAFRAFRNFDGKGGRFLDELVSSSAQEGASLWVSRAGNHLVVVALNFSPDKAIEEPMDFSSCGPVKSVEQFEFSGQKEGFRTVPKGVPANQVAPKLPPYSITVLDILLGT